MPPSSPSRPGRPPESSLATPAHRPPPLTSLPPSPTLLRPHGPKPFANLLPLPFGRKSLPHLPTDPTCGIVVAELEPWSWGSVECSMLTPHYRLAGLNAFGSALMVLQTPVRRDNEGHAVDTRRRAGGLSGPGGQRIRLVVGSNMDHLDVPQFLGLLVVILGAAKLFGLSRNGSASQPC